MTLSASQSFVESVAASFEIAARTQGLTEYSFQIAGGHLRLRFAGRALEPAILPALSHLASENKSSSAAELTIGLFDSASTGMDLRELPWEEWRSAAQMKRWYFENDNVKIFFQQGINALHIFDPKRNTAFFWVRNAAEAHEHLAACPLLIFFHWWLGGENHQLIHAASVGNAQGGVLLAGRAGRGKSTTAFACLQSNLKYAGDDRCIASLAPVPFIHSLYNSAKLNQDMIQKFPELTSQLTEGMRRADGKSVFFLHRHLPLKIISGFPLRALLFPQVARSAETFLTPLSSAQALRFLAPNTLLQLPGDKNPSFQFLTQLVRRVPSFLLKAGNSIAGIPPVIENLIAELSPKIEVVL